MTDTDAWNGYLAYLNSNPALKSKWGDILRSGGIDLKTIAATQEQEKSVPGIVKSLLARHGIDLKINGFRFEFSEIPGVSPEAQSIVKALNELQFNEPISDYEPRIKDFKTPDDLLDAFAADKAHKAEVERQRILSQSETLTNMMKGVQIMQIPNITTLEALRQQAQKMGVKELKSNLAETEEIIRLCESYRSTVSKKITDDTMSGWRHIIGPEETKEKVDERLRAREDDFATVEASVSLWQQIYGVLEEQLRQIQPYATTAHKEALLEIMRIAEEETQKIAKQLPRISVQPLKPKNLEKIAKLVRRHCDLCDSYSKAREQLRLISEEPITLSVGLTDINHWRFETPREVINLVDRRAQELWQPEVEK